jgi:hypothetical protein
MKNSFAPWRCISTEIDKSFEIKSGLVPFDLNNKLKRFSFFLNDFKSSKVLKFSIDNFESQIYHEACDDRQRKEQRNQDTDIAFKVVLK